MGDKSHCQARSWHGILLVAQTLWSKGGSASHAHPNRPPSLDCSSQPVVTYLYFKLNALNREHCPVKDMPVLCNSGYRGSPG